MENTFHNIWNLSPEEKRAFIVQLLAFSTKKDTKIGLIIDDSGNDFVTALVTLTRFLIQEQDRHDAHWQTAAIKILSSDELHIDTSPLPSSPPSQTHGKLNNRVPKKDGHTTSRISPNTITVSDNSAQNGNPRDNINITKNASIHASHNNNKTNPY